MENQTIKQVETKKYSISLIQASNDLYYVVYKYKTTGESHASEALRDYGIASYLFDLKISDLETH